MGTWIEVEQGERMILFSADAPLRDIVRATASEARRMDLMGSGETPQLLGALFLAVQYDRLDVVQTLAPFADIETNAGAHSGVPHDQRFPTLLAHACYKRRLGIVRHLLRMGADPRDDLCYPLSVACYAKQRLSVSWDDRGPRENASPEDLAALLLAYGAEVNHSTSPLEHACRRGNLSLVRYLLANGADPEQEGCVFVESPLYTHIRKRKLSTARALVELGIRLRPRERSGPVWEEFQRL